MNGFGPGGTDYEDKKLIEKLDIRATFKLLENAGLQQRTRKIRHRLLLTSSVMLLIVFFNIELSLSGLPFITKADDQAIKSVIGIYNFYLFVIYLVRYNIDTSTAVVFDFSAAVRHANKLHIDRFLDTISRKAAHHFVGRYSSHSEVESNVKYQHFFNEGFQTAFRNALYLTIKNRTTLPSKTSEVEKFEQDRSETTKLLSELRKTLKQYFESQHQEFSPSAFLDSTQYVVLPLLQDSLNSRLQEAYHEIDDNLFARIRNRVRLERIVFDLALPITIVCFAFLSYTGPLVLELLK